MKPDTYNGMPAVFKRRGGKFEIKVRAGAFVEGGRAKIACEKCAMGGSCPHGQPVRRELPRGGEVDRPRTGAWHSSAAG